MGVLAGNGLGAGCSGVEHPFNNGSSGCQDMNQRVLTIETDPTCAVRVYVLSDPQCSPASRLARVIGCVAGRGAWGSCKPPLPPQQPEPEATIDPPSCALTRPAIACPLPSPCLLPTAACTVTCRPSCRRLTPPRAPA